MFLRRSLIAAVAALSLTTAVFAAEEQAAASSDAKAAAAQVSADAKQATTDAAAPAAESASKVNINTATAKELAKVKGLTAAKAKAIVSFRKKHGEFKSLDDLKQVKGFKKAKPEQLKAIQDQLTIG